MTATTPRRPSGSWLPWLFVIFFAVVLAANGVMVFFAVRSWTGLETEQHYLKGLDHNRALEAAARQRSLGWAGDLSVGRGANGAVEVGVTLRDARREGVSGARVRLRFVRPTHAGQDFDLMLRETVPGQYRGKVTPPLPGQWDVRVTAQHRAGTYRLHRRVVLP